jgi:hypothetical protein
VGGGRGHKCHWLRPVSPFERAADLRMIGELWESIDDRAMHDGPPGRHGKEHAYDASREVRDALEGGPTLLTMCAEGACDHLLPLAGDANFLHPSNPVQSPWHCVLYDLLSGGLKELKVMDKSERNMATNLVMMFAVGKLGSLALASSW